ncbi:MAG: N-6 DNA methylase [Kineosporiaceae bacterium]
MNDERVVTAAAIARELGVGRAAVANWRKRHEDFPRPVDDGSATPRFFWSAVQQWLEDTGRAEQLTATGRTATGTHMLTSPTAPPSEPERDLTSLPPAEVFAAVIVSLLPELGTDDQDDADHDQPAVLDPACSDSALLAAAFERFGRRVRLTGQLVDAKPLPALQLAGAEVDLRQGNALVQDEFRGLRAPAVVCVPPASMRQWDAGAVADDPRWVYGLPDAGDPELAWVQHCLAHLRPRGVAVVAMSPVTAVRSSGRHMRASLLRAGVLKAVIALPTGLTLSGEGITHLWLLETPGVEAVTRMVDLTGVADPLDVPTSPSGWDAVFADPAVSRLVAAVELLDDDVALVPARHLLPRSGGAGTELADVADRLASLYAKVSRALVVPPAAGPQRFSEVTVAELERSQAVRILSRDATPRAGDVLFRTMRREPVVATGTAADDGGVAQVVAVDAERIDPWFLALFLRRDALAGPVANTLSAATREDVRRCRVPRLPVTEQRRYGDAHRRLHELDDVARRLAQATSALIEQTRHGLTTGSLSPRPRPSDRATK